jgi:SAM-dependent methyltransferase
VFTVAAESYDRFMGKFSGLLAPLFVDFAGVAPPARAVDVGCGPGALTAELAARLGPSNVAACDPSEPFVAAARERRPGVDVRLASAEELPFPSDEFDAALAQLVVHFMADPLAGVREMARVTRSGGVVAACVWDHGGGAGPLSGFWAAARELDPGVDDESGRTGASAGQLAELLRDARLGDVHESALTVSVAHATFDEWWEPFTFGVGTAGSYLASLDAEHRERLRDRCRAAVGGAPTILARAHTARGTVTS